MITGAVALRELARRARARAAGGLESRAQVALPAAELLKSHLFVQQRDVLEDPGEYIVAYCSRRSGKSMYVGTGCAYMAQAFPGSETAAYAPTLGMAKRNILKPIKQVCQRYNLRAKFDRQNNEVLWGNGSVTYLFGADRADDIDKARGLALHAAFVDEAQRFKEHLIEELIDEVLIPALEDYFGKLYLSGTPKATLSGYFYNACENPNSPYSVHRWTRAQNIYYPRFLKMQESDKRYKGMSVPEIAEARLEALLKANGWTRQTPKVRREWLGEWARDETSLIYPYKAERNFIEVLPDGHEWQYGVGVDLGMNALVVMAWARTSPTLYYVDAKKTEYTTLDALADDILAFKTKYSAKRIEADCAALGKYIVAEIRRRRPGLSIHAADKTQKLTAQEAMRTDLSAGRIKVLPKAKVLVDEWSILQYEEDGTEPKKADNHCSDAALYIHRWARHYAAKPKPPPDTRTPDQIEEDRMEASMFARAKRRKSEPNPRPNMAELLRSSRNARP